MSLAPADLDSIARGPALARDDFAALSTLMFASLSQSAGDGRCAIPVSFSVEFAVAAFPGQTVQASARIERATRTLMFVAAEAKSASGVRLAIASGVFRLNG